MTHQKEGNWKLVTENICHHNMVTKFQLLHGWWPKHFSRCRVDDQNLFLITHHNEGNLSENIFFVSILMDMINALKQTPTWCVMQNDHVTFVLTTLIVNLSKNEFSTKNLVDMRASFVLQVTKKDGSLYRPRRYVSFVCFVFHGFFFPQICCKVLFFFIFLNPKPIFCLCND